MRSDEAKDAARRQTIVVAMVAAVCGYLAVWVPWGLAVFYGTTTASNLMDGFQPVSVLLLALIGFVAGMVMPQRFWIGALFSMALFPMFAIWDMVRDPTSHNLFPIEFMVYGVLTVPGMIAGFMGKGVAEVAKRNR